MEFMPRLTDCLFSVLLPFWLIGVASGPQPEGVETADAFPRRRFDGLIGDLLAALNYDVRQETDHGAVKPAFMFGLARIIQQCVDSGHKVLTGRHGCDAKLQRIRVLEQGHDAVAFVGVKVHLQHVPLDHRDVPLRQI